LISISTINILYKQVHPKSSSRLYDKTTICLCMGWVHAVFN